MGLLSSDPEVVRKWLPRDLRQRIKRYQPKHITPQTEIDVWIRANTYGGETHVLLVFKFFQAKIVEYLNPVFHDAHADWKELAEVAAWAIMLEDSERLALVKQMVSELGNNERHLWLSHARCTTHKSVGNGPDPEPLREVRFS